MRVIDSTAWAPGGADPVAGMLDHRPVEVRVKYTRRAIRYQQKNPRRGQLDVSKLRGQTEEAEERRQMYAQTVDERVEQARATKELLWEDVSTIMVEVAEQQLGRVGGGRCEPWMDGHHSERQDLVGCESFGGGKREGEHSRICSARSAQTGG